jgi:hypothetical protein
MKRGEQRYCSGRRTRGWWRHDTRYCTGRLAVRYSEDYTTVLVASWHRNQCLWFQYFDALPTTCSPPAGHRRSTLEESPWPIGPRYWPLPVFHQLTLVRLETGLPKQFHQSFGQQQICLLLCSSWRVGRVIGSLVNSVTSSRSWSQRRCLDGFKS